MSQYQVVLPEAADQFVKEQVATGKFSSPSDVLVDAVEQARRRAAEEKLVALIKEGLESGTPIPVTRESREQRRAELLARLPPGIAE